MARQARRARAAATGRGERGKGARSCCGWGRRRRRNRGSFRHRRGARGALEVARQVPGEPRGERHVVVELVGSDCRRSSRGLLVERGPIRGGRRRQTATGKSKQTTARQRLLKPRARLPQPLREPRSQRPAPPQRPADRSASAAPRLESRQAAALDSAERAQASGSSPEREVSFRRSRSCLETSASTSDASEGHREGSRGRRGGADATELRAEESLFR